MSRPNTENGYWIIHVVIDSGDVVKVEPFIVGWLDVEEDCVRGRLVDTLNMPDSSMLVSRDSADTIYRVTYHHEN